jgi:membrane protein
MPRRAELDREIAADVIAVEGRSSRFLGRHPRAARTAALAEAVVRREGTQQLGLAASGAAFWLVISAAPIAVAVVSLYGLIVEPARVAGDLGNLANAAPASLGLLIRGQLQRVAATDGTQLTIGLIFSVVLAVWSASAGIYNLSCAIRDAYGLRRQRYVDARARSLAAAAVLVVVLGAIALTTAATLAHSRGLLPLAVGVPSVFVCIVAALTGLYRFAVGQPMRLRALLPGAVAAAAGMIALLIGFGAYASASTHFTAVYGAFGAAVIAMLATYLAVYATLLGAVLNVVLARTHPSASRTSETSA